MKKFTLLFITWVVFSTIINAQGVSRKTYTLSNIEDMDSLIVGDTLNLFDPLLPNLSQTTTAWHGKYCFNNVEGVVKLSLKDNMTISAPGDTFSCKVTVQVRYWTTTNEDLTDTALLVVTYDKRKGLKYQEAALKKFSNAHYVGITITGISNPAVRSFLQIEAQLNGERSVCLSAFDVFRKPPVKKTVYDTLTREFVVTIKEDTLLEQAEELDLEWTFVDYQDNTNYNTTTHVGNYDFRNNASRVVLGRNQRTFRLKNVFERGVLLFRYRTAAYYENAEGVYIRVAGRWSNETSETDPDKGTFDADDVAENDTTGVRSAIIIIPEDGHLPLINWQYVSVFAEEGKRKETISYFDGSLRNRQTVTTNNSDHTVLVQENVYDFNGRPAIEILPVPIAGLFSFYPNLNRNSGDSAYTAYNFDVDDESDVCDPATLATMNKNSGASRYYSDSNTFIQSSATVYDFNKYVPVANGYPFMQTSYMPDNTGRVLAKSGVGSTHQISGGKATYFAYETPFQEELNRLFGTEVGYNVHYKKSSVVDANGQPSVTYTDLKGKTIATALAANPSNGLQSLSSNTSRTNIEVDLVTGQETEQRDDEIIISKRFTVLEQGVYKFKYSLNPAEYLPGLCSGEATPCYDCIYDLEISLVNMCGAEQFQGEGTASKTLIRRVIGGNPAEVNGACASGDGYSFSGDALLSSGADVNGFISVTLDPGSYTISKSLKVNKEAFKNAEADYFSHQTCITLDSFESIAFARMDTTGCELSCEQCDIFETVSREGFVDGKDTEHYNTYGVHISNEERDNWRAYYDASKARCLELGCEQMSVCDAYLDMLRADVKPGGQYAAFAYGEEGEVVIDNTISLNVLDSNNENSYRNFPDEMIIYIHGQERKVKDLSVSEFIDNWQPQWADSLAKHHPEYCEYTWCRDNKVLYDYELDVMKVETFEEAVSKGYMGANAFTIGSLLYQNDSLFYATQYNTPRTQFETSLAANAPQLKMDLYDPGTPSDTMDDQLTSIPWEDYLIYRFFISKDTYERVYLTYMNQVNVAKLSIVECHASGDEYWINLRGIYLSERKKVLDAWKLTNNVCGTIPSGAERRFYSNGTTWPNAAPGETTPNQTTVQDSMITNYESQCESYRAIWADNLKGCNLDSAQMSQLTEQLKQVCINGSDANFPMGSSSVAPSQVGFVTYISFEDVMKRYPVEMASLRSYIYNKQLCSDLQISFPASYGHDYFAKESPYADTCACINPLDTNCPCNTTLTHPRAISTAETKMLRSSVPDEQKCDNCIDCPVYASVFEEFYTGFPELFDTTAENYDEANRNASLRSYMNEKLGFNLSQDDYARFAAKCLGYSEGASVVNAFNEYIVIYESLQLRNFSRTGIKSPAKTKNGVRPLPPYLWDEFLKTVKENELRQKWVPLKYRYVFGDNDFTPNLMDCMCDSITTNPGKFLTPSPEEGVPVGNYDGPNGTAFTDKVMTRCTAYLAALQACDDNYVPSDWNGDGNIDEDDRTIGVGTCKNGVRNDFLDLHRQDPIRVSYDKGEGALFGFCSGGGGGEGGAPGVAQCITLMPVFQAYYDTSIAPVFEPTEIMSVSLNEFLKRPANKALTDTLIALLNSYGANIELLLDVNWQVNYMWDILFTCKTVSCSSFLTVAHSYDSLVYAPVRDTSGKSLREYVWLNADTVSAITAGLYDSLNYYFNKPPYLSFFDRIETERHFMSCAMNICEPVSNQVDIFKINHPELFAPGLKIKQVLRDTANAVLVAGLLADVNAITIKSPYFRVLDLNELVISVDMCWSCQDISTVPMGPYQGVMNAFFSVSAGSNKLGLKSGWLLKDSLSPFLSSYFGKNAYKNSLKYEIEELAPDSSYLYGKISTITGQPFYFKLYTIEGDSGADGRLRYSPATPPLYFGFAGMYAYSAFRMVKMSSSEVGVTFSAYYESGGNTYHQRMMIVMPAWPYYNTLASEQTCRDNPSLCNKPLGSFTITIDENPCIKRLRIISKINARNNYEQYVQKLKDDFYKGYMEKCMRKSLLNETFKMKYDERQYHYTLYYYDQAGNLVKTVPPAGVKPLNAVATAAINGKRDSVLTQAVAHEKTTLYAYNTLNELIWQRTPDAGESNFWYDALGRIVLSQNAKQKTAAYSYTIYDALGRISEVGQATSLPNTVNHDNVRAVTQMNAWLDSLITSGGSTWSPATRTQITNTYYDGFALTGHHTLIAGDFENLRGRVVHSTFRDYAGASYQTGVHYSYDIHGNVKRLYREICALSALDMDQDLKTVDYHYDLISGKVNEVVYQQGMADQYIHRYTYDEDNRITSVLSGITENTLDEEATYQYYKHGPLARTEIGEHDVQGLDYVYTVQGWLKSVNASTLGGARDPGHDAYASVSTNAFTAKDVFGFELSYFHNDYTPVSSSVSGTYSPATIVGTSSTIHAAASQLYNGNIRYMVTNVSTLTPLLSAYKYDQLNRIASATYYSDLDSAANSWNNSAAALSAYHNAFEYDADGNITKQVRNGEAGRTNMDNLTYNYIAGTNRLSYVSDTSGTLLYSDDIDNQANNNYAYDSIGNLTKDVSEDITGITWNVYGKISRISYNAVSGKPDIEYQYTPDGHRAVKIVIPKSFQQLPVYTYYVRDAQGNVMATYERRMRRVVDFEKITFTQANDRLVTQLGSSSFQSFIGELHADNQLMKDSIYNRITGVTNGARDFLYNFSPVNIIAADTALQRYILTHITGDEYKEGVRFKPDYRQLLCDYMQNTNPTGQTLFQWYMRNAAGIDLERYIIGMYYNDRPAFDSVQARFGYSNGAYDSQFRNTPAQARIDTLTMLGVHTCAHVQPTMYYFNLVPNVPDVIMEDVRSTGGIFDNVSEFVSYLYNSNTTTNKQQVWQYIFGYKGSANATLAWYRDSAGAFFMTQAASQMRVAIDTIQSQHKLYSSTNNMEQYFTEIGQRKGQSTYDAMTLYFYNLWRTYTDKISITERHIYGSSRLGVNSVSHTLYTAKYEDVNNNSVLDSSEKTFENYAGDLNEINQQVERGYRRYELSNHLGNVLAVVSDKHIPIFSGATFTYYEAELLQASDYSPFGAPLTGRTKDFISALNKTTLLDQNFDTSTTVEGWNFVTTNTTTSIESGRLKYASTYSGSGGALIRKALSTTPGKKYRLSLDIEVTTGYASNSFLEIIASGSISYSQLKPKSHYVLEFIANAATASIQVSLAGVGTTRLAYIDNVKLEEINGDEGGYRFGFNAQERDDEVSGGGNVYDFQLRTYDSRLGRFFSVDPIGKSFPWNSTYAYAENRVIEGKDFEGGEFVHYTTVAVTDKNRPAVKNTGMTFSSWVNRLMYKWFDINLEPAKIFTLQYGDRTYMFKSFKEMMHVDVTKLDPKTTPTYDNLVGLMQFTDAAGAAAANFAALGALRPNSVRTPFSVAVQSTSEAAVAAIDQVAEGTTLYRIGTTGISETGANAQFWALENPLVDPAAFAQKYNIPIDNIKNANFIETAVVKKGANYVTRQAGTAPGSANTGTGIEVVVEQGGTTNNVITPIVKQD